MSVEGINPWADWLLGLAGEHSGGAVAQKLTLWSRIHVSRVLMPAQSALCVCRLGYGPGWCLLGGALPQVKFSCSLCLPEATWHEPPINLQKVITYVGLGGATRFQTAN